MGMDAGDDNRAGSSPTGFKRSVVDIRLDTGLSQLT